MNAQDVFGVVVRVIGLWMMAQAVMLISGIFAAPIVLLAIIVESGVGCFLFFGADQIVAAAYDRRQSNDIQSPPTQ